MKKSIPILIVVVVVSCGLLLMAAPSRDIKPGNDSRLRAHHVQSLLATQLLGPVPYRSFADSPFASPTPLTFYLEDFEDGLLNVPNVTIDRGSVTSVRFCHEPNITDSVDGDDGNPADGACIDCDSYFGNGVPGLTISFAQDAPLPPHAGVVWTAGAGFTRFEAFDENGASLGVVGPVAIADGTFNTSMGEDRFFGVIHETGISSVKIGNTEGGIEIDHLQFGYAVDCGDRDGDGYGTLVTSVCPAGDAIDCDDNENRAFPGAQEVYDGVDNDCDQVADEGFDDDADGVPNFNDECNDTLPGSGVSPDGCAVRCEDDDDDGGDHDDDDHGGRGHKTRVRR